MANKIPFPTIKQKYIPEPTMCQLLTKEMVNVSASRQSHVDLHIKMGPPQLQLPGSFMQLNNFSKTSSCSKHVDHKTFAVPKIPIPNNNIKSKGFESCKLPMSSFPSISKVKNIPPDGLLPVLSRSATLSGKENSSINVSNHVSTDTN